MEQKHRSAIQSNFTSLVERTDLDSMVDSLCEKGVFSERMIEPFRNKNEAPRERKRKLYREVTKRGPHAFRHLVDTLLELGYWDIVRDLDPDNPFSNTRPLNPSRPSSSRPMNTSRPSNSNHNNEKRQSGDEFLSLSEQNKKINEQKNNMPQPVPDQDINDNDTDVTEFTVIKANKFMVDDDSNDLKLYNTRSPRRGVLVIFNYVSFKDGIDLFRNGGEADCKMLKNLFSEIGFQVLAYPNLERKETLDTLESLKEVLVDVDCVFIVVSSHGYQRNDKSIDIEIRCHDGYLLSIYEIMDYFSNQQLPKLIGIPKVFIFQVCRGNSDEYVLYNSPTPPQLPMPAGDVQTDGQPVPPAALAGHRRPAPTCGKVPLYSDILIAHSTTPGNVSYRDKKRGSWYIQALCQVFAERAHNTHVDKLFTLVDKRMRDVHGIQTSSVDRWGFNKRLYLHPGLHERSGNQEGTST